METQVDVDVISAGTITEPARLRWLVCDNGMTVAEGIARYQSNSGIVEWDDHPPPASLYTRVVLEMDRAVKRRLNS